MCVWPYIHFPLKWRRRRPQLPFLKSPVIAVNQVNWCSYNAIRHDRSCALTSEISILNSVICDRFPWKILEAEEVQRPRSESILIIVCNIFKMLHMVQVTAVDAKQDLSLFSSSSYARGHTTRDPSIQRTARNTKIPYINLTQFSQ